MVVVVLGLNLTSNHFLLIIDSMPLATRMGISFRSGQSPSLISIEYYVIGLEVIF